MATFDIENNVFIKALTLNSQSSVLALSTAGNFVNRNISVQITAKSGSASTPATTIAQAPTITLTTATGSIVAEYNKSQSITPTVTAGWVNAGTAGTISTTGSASLILPTAGIDLTNNQFSITPGWIGATTALSVQTVSMTATTASKSGTSFTQGILSVPTGYISATTVTCTSFANSASSGTTYLDISDTTGAPILASEGYLYINRGYTDNVRISLAKLIPDDANVSASDQLRSGYAAYDSAGNLITGNIPDKSSSDVTESTSNVIVPSGYYASTVTLALDVGDYSAGVTLSAVTVTPSVSITDASTYGFTTTQPSSGTYITIVPTADSPTYSATATATISTAGYLAVGNKNTSQTATVGVYAGTNYYTPVITPTFNGGELTVSSTNAITTNMATTSTSSYYIDAVAAITATRAQVNYNNAAGAIAAHSGATAIAVDRSNTSASATRVYIPEATFSTTYTGLNDLSLTATYAAGITYAFTDDYNNNLLVSCTATRGTIRVNVYGNTEGYVVPNTTLYGAGVSTNSFEIGRYCYLRGVTLNKPASGEAKFSITVPNGEDNNMITFVFHVDPSGNVVVDDSTSNAFS